MNVLGFDPHPHVKLSVSIPAELAEFARARSAERGVALSAFVAEALRHELEAERQALLDEALRLDGEENRRYAEATAATSHRVLEGLEW